MSDGPPIFRSVPPICTRGLPGQSLLFCGYAERGIMQHCWMRDFAVAGPWSSARRVGAALPASKRRWQPGPIPPAKLKLIDAYYTGLRACSLLAEASRRVLLPILVRGSSRTGQDLAVLENDLCSEGLSNMDRGEHEWFLKTVLESLLNLGRQRARGAKWLSQQQEAPSHKQEQ